MVLQSASTFFLAVLCGIVSLFFPGLGQLFQGRWFVAIVALCVSIGLWVVALGWVGHIIAAIDAAMYRPKRLTQSP
ncbi:MAG: hypothetical protein E6Q97_00055 [Desulfurellales bacterium]|nr:MAG: hypothetical protein E6Q97_00055 [Desulfurellales bacterium]